MLPEPIRSALAAIARSLDERGVDYAIGGSAMLALDGFDVPVGDIDVVVAGEARREIESIFPDHRERESVEPWQSTWILKARWGSEDTVVSVDVIGDLGLRINGEIVRFPLVSDRKPTVDDTGVQLAPLRHWYHLYREYSPRKAGLIAERLTPEEIAAGASELGIVDPVSPTLVVGIGNEPAEKPIEQDMATEPQSSIIEVASPTDVTFDAPGEEAIDLDLLNETLEYIRPALQADGGDLVLLGTEGGKVTLQMVGACGGCPLSTMTLTAGIERILQDRVPGVTEVVAI